MIMNCDDETTIANAFAIVKQYDRALYQHDTTDFMSLLVDSSKS
jgi:hypothetical protein